MMKNENIDFKNSEILKKIIEFAYTNVPFYIYVHEGIPEMDKVPVIDKRMIKDVEDLTSFQYARWNIPSMDTFKTQTSGSTGKCMDILWEKHDYATSMLPLWLYRYKYYNIKTDDKFCYFYTVGNMAESFVDIKFYEKVKNALGFSKSNLDSGRVLEICKMMKEFNPVWINTQPSMALMLAKCFKKNKLDKIESLRYIELTGEMLFDNVRKEIEETFECKVANQYGCYEANSIAYECPYGNMHCMEDNVYVEVLDDNNKSIENDNENTEGNIVITTLNNYAMPFVRYKTGDRGIMYKNHSCKCGNCSPILKLTSGRVTDYALMKDGSKVSSYVFVRAVDLVNRQMENVIRQFRVVQTDYDYFIIHLELDYEAMEEIVYENIYQEINESVVEDMFLRSLNDKHLYDTNFEFYYHDNLELDMKDRKLRYFVREVEEDENIEKNINNI